MNLSTPLCIKILILRLFLFYMFTHIHMHVLMTKSMYRTYKFIEILSVPHCNSSQNLIQGFALFFIVFGKKCDEFLLVSVDFIIKIIYSLRNKLINHKIVIIKDRSKRLRKNHTCCLIKSSMVQ